MAVLQNTIVEKISFKAGNCVRHSHANRIPRDMEHIIIIPTYNERGNIKSILDKIFKILPFVSVLVVDDNSPDKTADEVLRLKKIYPNVDLLLRTAKEGLGKAYIHAFQKVLADGKAKKIIMMDCDLSHDPSFLPGMIQASETFDLVVGSRYVHGGKTEGWKLWRRMLSRYGNLYCKTITGMPVSDGTGGFNVIDAGVLGKINLRDFGSSGYAFQVELKHALFKNGAKVIELPITFKNRTGGESKISGFIISEGLVAPWKLRFKKTKTNVACGMCTEKNIGHFTKKNGHNLFKCRSCGFIFVWPAPASVGQIYSSDYFSGATEGFGYVDYDGDKQAMEATFNSYLDTLDHFSHGRRGALLDIGAATGFFLGLAHKRGWQVSGLEVSDWAAKKGRERGLNIQTGDLASADFKDNSFDAIALLDVLEHLPNPRADLAIVKDLLKTNGLILINTPDAGSFYAKVLGTRWHSLVPPEHLSYFSHATLSHVLRISGFEVLFSGRIGKRFSLQYCVKTAANWLKLGFLHTLADKLKNSRWGSIAIPVNLRDNLTVIARKV